MGKHERATVRPAGGAGSWLDRVRGVFFRVAAEAWVETVRVGRHQWGWRLRSREGRVLKALNGRHEDRDAAFEAAVRFFRRRSAVADDFGRFGGERSGRPPERLPGEAPETGARADRGQLTRNGRYPTQPPESGPGRPAPPDRRPLLRLSVKLNGD